MRHSLGMSGDARVFRPHLCCNEQMRQLCTSSTRAVRLNKSPLNMSSCSCCGDQCVGLKLEACSRVGFVIRTCFFFVAGPFSITVHRSLSRIQGSRRQGSCDTAPIWVTYRPVVVVSVASDGGVLCILCDGSSLSKITARTDSDASRH